MARRKRAMSDVGDYRDSDTACLVTRGRRFSDLGDSSAITKSWNTLRHRAHTRAVGVFKKNLLSTRHISLQRFSGIIPEPEDHLDKDVLCSFLKFLICSPTVTDAELQKIMPLVQVTSKYRMGRAKYVAYLRSFPMPAKTLELILKEMKELGMVNDTTAAFWSLCEEAEPTTIITVRYIGATTVFMGPWKRYTRDITLARKHQCTRNTIFGKFARAADEVAPQIFDDVKIWIFPSTVIQGIEEPASTGSSSPTMKAIFTNDFEAYIIALFESKFLLNKQVGGVAIAYQYDEADAASFQRLETAVCDTFNNHKHELPPVIKDSLGDLFKEAQGAINAKPSAYGLKETLLQDEFREQSTPYEDLKHNVAFSQSQSPAAIRQRRLFKFLEFVESGTTSEYVKNPLFCWSNLSYWKNEHQPQVASQMYRRYIKLLAPWIVVTYGIHATAVCVNGFGSHTEWSVRENFTATAGVPRLASWQPGAGNQKSSDTDDCFIHLSAIHPGSESWIGASTHSRVRQLTEFAIFVYIDTAMKTVANDVSDKTRQQICEEIISAARKRLQDVGFHDIFNTAKEALHNSTAKANHGERHWRPSHGDALELNQLKDLIFASGVAEGYGASPDRIMQLDGLWQHAVPSLHQVYPHEESNRKAWVEELSNLPIGCYFQAWAMAKLPQDELPFHWRKALAEHGPPCDNFVQRLQVFNSFCTTFLSKYMDELNYFEEVFPPTAMIDGSEVRVTIGLRSHITIRWKKDDGSRVRPRVIIEATPLFSNAYRNCIRLRIFFVESGVNIVDQFGTILLHKSKSRTPAQLWELWEAVMTYKQGNLIPSIPIIELMKLCEFEEEKIPSKKRGKGSQKVLPNKIQREY